MNAAENLIDLTAQDVAADAPLAVNGLTVSYGHAPAVFSVDVAFRTGAMTAIVGPNGAGKSTFLKAALGLQKRLSGQVSFFGAPLGQVRSRVAYVPQRSSVDWDFPARVFDVVMMGQFRRMGLLRPVGDAQRAAVLDALARVGMANFADRQIGQLSGGQQQRVFLARALVQGADLYLLDEPFAGVDAATERAILTVLQGLRDAGKTVVVVHHDLSTVQGYFDDVMLLNVRKQAHGPVAQVFTESALQATYGGRLATAQIDQLNLG